MWKQLMEVTHNTQGEMRNASRILVENRERMIPLGTRRRKWEDNIKVDLKEMRCQVTYSIQPVQYRHQWFL
jgi:hypothetical protein